MARPHIEFIDSRDLPEELVDDGPLAGARRRLLSEDDTDGSYTLLVNAPSGWSTELGHEGRPLELFCVRGDLQLADRASGTGCYAYIPGSNPGRSLISDDGALFFLFVGPERAEEGEIEIVETDKMKWTAPGDIGHTGAGITVKPLHMHPVTGDSVWLAGIVPGWFLTETEKHPVAQEVFMLEGDVLLPPHGSMTAGCYFWRPPFGLHGPLISRSGALILMRSFTGDFTTEWFESPGYEELHAEYLAERPLLADLSPADEPTLAQG